MDQLKQAQESLENKQKEKTETTEEIATSQADLTETTAMLNDDRVYLKDLTEKSHICLRLCEAMLSGCTDSVVKSEEV